MLLEPRQSSKANRVIGGITEHELVPSSCLIQAADLLSKLSKAMVEVWMRLQAEG
jgi:hypothetical protein